jgi:hypothetical protein
MTQLNFDFDIEGALQDDPYLDSYELNYLFEQTKASISRDIERKLGDTRCGDHNEEATITVTGRYGGDSEQLEIDYHVDTCCKMFMVQVIATLNNVN